MNHVSKTPYVLFLSAWYPHPDDFTFGIFVQRHAQDLAKQGVRVVVAWVFNGVSNIHRPTLNKKDDGLLTEYLLFYPKSSQEGMLGQFFRTFDYLSHYSSLIQQVMQIEGKPNQVVLNVALRAGLLAWWLKYTRGIPFTLIEHWSGYLPEDGRYQGKWMKKATEVIFKEAKMVLTISKQMRDNMVNRHGLKMRQHEVLPNSVDTALFNYSLEKQHVDYPYFYHVSNFVREKEVPLMLEVFELGWKNGLKHSLVLSGDGPEAGFIKGKYQHRIDSGLLKMTGRLMPAEIAQYMQQATALVLFSHFEGLPCVMLEAWCCGLPVIATAVGGIPEVLNEQNGVLIQVHDTQALLEAITQLSEGRIQFNRFEIHQEAIKKYASEAVGRQLKQLLFPIS